MPGCGVFDETSAQDVRVQPVPGAGQRGGAEGGAGVVARAHGAPDQRAGAAALAPLPRGARRRGRRALPPAQALARARGQGAPTSRMQLV